MPDEYREMIMHAYEGEMATSRFYYAMSRAAVNPVCASILASASNDEYRHAQMLAVLLSGSCPAASVGVDSVQVTPADLERAAQGEMGALCEYATLARLAPTMQERLLFISILGDEFGHLRIFTTMQATDCR